MSRKSPLRIALWIALSLTAMGCASSTGISAARTVTHERDGELIVRNNNTRDVNLYVVSGSGRVRLGTARSMATSRLRIPAVYMHPATGIVLQADPIGATASYTFPSMHIEASDRVEIDVANSLSLSSFGIFRR